ncbi:MAG: Gfo/Idh/MocA family oxidoreductase [Candidatus Brocadiia bacterium]
MFQSVFTDELAVPFEEALDTLVDWGVQYADLRGGIYGKAIHDLTEEELARVQKALNDRDLKVGTLESSLAKVHLPDQKRREKEAEKLEGLIRAADALECRLIRSFFFWQPPEEKRGQLAVRPDEKQQVLDAFRPLAERAKEANLVLAFENCGVSTEEVNAVLDALAEPRWGLAWDVSNEWLGDNNPPENVDQYIDSCAKRTRLVHVKAQGSVEELGETAPYDRILQSLDNHGFNGPVSIETHNPDRSVSNAEMTHNALEAIRSAWPSAAPGMLKQPETEKKEIVREYDPVRFVVVGLGMGKSRAKLVQETSGTELIGVCDIDEERAQKVGEELDVPYTFDVKEWLENDDAEVIYVMTWSGAHADVAVQALEANKHVLTTKPMDVSLEACDRMIRAAEERDLLLAVDFGRRFTSDLLSTRKFVQDGKLGQILGAQVSLKVLRPDSYFEGKGSWHGTLELDGGGVLSNQCIHHIDEAVFVLGVPEAARADIWTQNHDIEGEDLACANWRYEDGSIVNLYATTCFPHKTWYFEFEAYGTEGALTRASGGPLEENRERYFIDDVWMDEPPERIESEWLNAADNFADALRTGAPLVCDGRDGRRTQAVLDAMYRSGRGDGDWVEVRSELD